ncbi:hypothetical protein NKH17_12360 [Mesorhizobium sp. M1334]|uniref:hypothetical protein n=1 Tax=Mesorhizobium sp. M1334 TaxID=2957084 RepID=UPI0033377436
MAGTAASYKDALAATRNRSVTTAGGLDIARQILVDETDTPSLGAAADAAASSDTGTFSLISLFKRLLGKFPTLGPKAASGSVSVTLSTDDDLLIGSLTETAPATDTASSGLNGRLQRIAQRLTTLMASTLRVLSPASATSTPTNVAGATSTTTLLAANANRLGGSIVNDSTAILYILLGSGTASATNYSYVLDGKTTVGGTFEIPEGWTGAIQGIWASATGSARVTERTA